jgi:6-phosphogluconate dehydrogenase
MSQLGDIGVTGLAVMGANLARNAARKGFRVAVQTMSSGSASLSSIMSGS